MLWPDPLMMCCSTGLGLVTENSLHCSGCHSEIVKGWIGSRAIVEADSGRWDLFAKGVDRGCDMVENYVIVLVQVQIGYEEFVWVFTFLYLQVE